MTAIQQIKEKYNKQKDKLPGYLDERTFSYILPEYAHIRHLMTLSLANNILPDDRIGVINNAMMQSTDRIKKILPLDQTIMVFNEFSSVVDDMIADCIFLEIYESAANLEKIKHTFLF